MTVSLTEFERTFNISLGFVTMVGNENVGTGTSTSTDTSTGISTGTVPGSPSGTTTLSNIITISGNGEIGSKLKSDVSQLFDPNGMSKLTYQWVVGGIDVAGATKATYTIQKADYDKLIKLRVSYTDINFNTITKESNVIFCIHGTYVNDIVEFKLAWETLFIPKTLKTYNTTLEKIDNVLWLYDNSGMCIKQILNSDNNITKTSSTFKTELPDHPDTTKSFNITSNISTFQVDFTKIDSQIKYVVFGVYEITTPPNTQFLPKDMYPVENWASTADLTKKVSVLGTVSPFKKIFNNTGKIVLDINTLGTPKLPKSILKTGDEKRLHSATADSKERLCIFGVFTRSPDNNGWFFESKYKVKTQLNGIKPLDYLKPSSKFTDLGL